MTVRLDQAPTRCPAAHARYELALQDRIAHDFEHLTMVAGGLVMWWPVLSPVRAVPPAVAPMQVLSEPRRRRSRVPARSRQQTPAFQPPRLSPPLRSLSRAQARSRRTIRASRQRPQRPQRPAGCAGDRRAVRCDGRALPAQHALRVVT